MLRGNERDRCTRLTGTTCPTNTMGVVWKKNITSLYDLDKILEELILFKHGQILIT